MRGDGGRRRGYIKEQRGEERCERVRGEAGYMRVGSKAREEVKERDEDWVKDGGRGKGREVIEGVRGVVCG